MKLEELIDKHQPRVNRWVWLLYCSPIIALFIYSVWTGRLWA
jgi:hypothetical protein